MHMREKTCCRSIQSRQRALSDCLPLFQSDFEGIFKFRGTLKKVQSQITTSPTSRDFPNDNEPSLGHKLLPWEFHTF